MSRIKEDLSGRVFNGLTVIERDLSKIGSLRGSYWFCECLCGNVKSISRHDLVVHNAKTCGCRAGGFYNSKYKDNTADKNQWINKYKRRCKKNGVEFSLTNEQFFDICSKDCHYCGVEPTVKTHGYIRVNKSDRFIYKANGIDRVDPNIGYSIGNSLPCCTVCNFMKTDKSYDDFLDLVDKIHNNKENRRKHWQQEK